MLRYRLLLACLIVAGPIPAVAQSGPVNVLTPAPPPREGTVGPEQLRDFSLPGTRQAPAEPETARLPVAVPRPRTVAPAPARPRASAPANDPVLAVERAIEPQVALPEIEPAAPSVPDVGPVAPSLPLSTIPQPAPTTLPPAAATVSESDGWWPWLLLAAVAGIGLALYLRRRSAGEAFEEPADEFAYSAPVPAPPPANTLPPPASEPALPSGLVTTRLRSDLGASPAQPAIPTGAVVSTRLRPWLDLDLMVGEIELLENEAVLHFRLGLTNSGSATARDLAIEALALNAGDTQEAELAQFFDRPPAAEAGVAMLSPMETSEVVHAVRMPRGAIREYAADGRRLFVPVLAFNIHYRWSNGAGQSSAAFLVGHQQPASDRLAPLRLDRGASRLGSLGTRRLDPRRRA